MLKKSSTSKRVIVVDDNVQAADSLARLLVAMGHEAHACYSGEATLTQIEGGWPDILIVDIGMPEMDGYELVHTLQQSNTANVPIVALTGYGFAHDKARALEAGFSRHVTKPIGIRELEEVLTLVQPHFSEGKKRGAGPVDKFS